MVGVRLIEMARSVICVALCSFAFSTASASDIGGIRSTGAGLTLGHPTGLTVKSYLGGETQAVEISLGRTIWGIGRGRWMASGLWMWHPSVLLEDPVLDVTWFIGAGGFAAIGGRPDARLPPQWRDALLHGGVRIPVGVDANLADAPWQITAEASLYTFVFPRVAATIGGSLSARYYF